MIHLKLVGQVIGGYEIGTRQEFDRLHGGDPAWRFLDNDWTTESFDLTDFLRDPTSYHVDQYGVIQKITVSKPDPFLMTIYDSDETVLVDADGSPVVENTRFTQPIIPIDTDGVTLIDDDEVSVFIRR